MTIGRTGGPKPLWVIIGLCTACASANATTTEPADADAEETVKVDAESDDAAAALGERFDAWKARPASQRDVAELEALAVVALGLDTCEGECVSLVLQVGAALQSAANSVRADAPERANTLIETKLRTEMMIAIHQLAIITAGDLIDARADLALARQALDDALSWEADLEYDEKTYSRMSAEEFETFRRRYRAMAQANLASLAIAESRFEDAIAWIDVAEDSGHRSLRSHQERARATSALTGAVPDAATRRAAADACFADLVDQPGCLTLFDVETEEPTPGKARRNAAIAAARRRVLEREAPSEGVLRATRPAQAYAAQHALDDRPTLVAVASKYCKPCKDDPKELAQAAQACPDARLLLLWETDDGEAPDSGAENLEVVAVDEEASQPPTGYPHHAVYSGGEVVFAGSGASLDGWWRFMFELEAAGAKCEVPAYPQPSSRTGWGSHASSG